MRHWVQPFSVQMADGRSLVRWAQHYEVSRARVLSFYIHPGGMGPSYRVGAMNGGEWAEVLPPSIEGTRKFRKWPDMLAFVRAEAENNRDPAPVS